MPHLWMKGIALTGGLGIQMGLTAHGHPGVVRHQLADLDLVATSLDAVSSRIVDRFLVSHYHVVRPGVPKFMIQLVDPESRIRIDVFPDLVGSIGDARTIHIGQHAMPVLPLDRIFEHKIHMLMCASPAAPIDPKHVQDALSLGAVLSRAVPEVTATAVTPDVYGIDADRSCNRCDLSLHPEWPLAPKERICELLGWHKGGTSACNRRWPTRSLAAAAETPDVRTPDWMGHHLRERSHASRRRPNGRR